MNTRLAPLSLLLLQKINYHLFMIKEQFKKAFLTPIQSIKKQYIPLLLIYFAYGLQGITAVTLTFWEKENLTLSTEQFVVISTWLTMPWTLKMIFGQFVDTVKIFGSNRKAYVYIGAILMTLGYEVLYGLMSKADWVMWMGSEFTIYLTSSLLSVFGFMLQDVTADTMTTEVVDREGKDEATIKEEITMVQILGRLSLMIAGVVAAFGTGSLAVLFEGNPEKIAFVAMGIPLISIIGASVVKLHQDEDVDTPKFNRVIMSGGVFYAFFMLLMAFWDSLFVEAKGLVALVSTYNQEVTFVVSLMLLIYLIQWMIKDESKERRKIIWSVFAAIFIFRATPGTGPGFSWWAIDVLGFDREFFGLLKIISSFVPLVLLWLAADYISSRPVRSILLFLIVVGAILNLPELGLFYGVHDMLGLSPRFVTIADTVLDSPLVHISMIPTLALIAFFAPASARGTWFAVGSSFMNLAITAGALGTKYLNRIFVVSREVLDETGAVTTAMNYELLGTIMIWKILISLIVPLVAVLWLLDAKKMGKI